jgi:hypothetical protein
MRGYTLISVQTTELTLRCTYNIVEIFEGKEEVKSVVQRLSRCDRPSWTTVGRITLSANLRRPGNMMLTHNPARDPTASMNPHAI